MIERFSSKHPPAVYLVGTEVLVRRFNSKYRKKVGTKSASKSTRIVEGNIIDKNLQNNTYKIQYTLGGAHSGRMVSSFRCYLSNPERGKE